ncbi:hypothetical protein EON65_49760 [archaeon]|nr:MAG: hypothetical protein EON65_49760 [archaeon]
MRIKYLVGITGLYLLSGCSNPDTSLAQKPQEISLIEHPRPRVARTANIISKRLPPAYYKGSQFRGSDEEIHRKYIFNNLDAMNFRDLEQDPIFGGNGINSSDLELERELFLVVKPSVPQLQNGIMNVLSKLQQSSSFEEIESRGSGRSTRPYRTTITYQTVFDGPIFKLTSVIKSESPTDPNTYFTETEERNDMRFSLLALGRERESIILSLIPSAGYENGVNPYTLSGSSSAHEGAAKIYPGYMRSVSYSVVDNETGRVLSRSDVIVTYDERKLDGLDKFGQNMWPIGNRFFVRSKYAILLEYLSLLYNELHTQLKVD